MGESSMNKGAKKRGIFIKFLMCFFGAHSAAIMLIGAL